MYAVQQYFIVIKVLKKYILAKTYFCRQKLFLPVRFFPWKKTGFFPWKKTGFSTFWQKPANPVDKWPSLMPEQRILGALNGRQTHAHLQCQTVVGRALCGQQQTNASQALSRRRLL